MLIDCPSCQTQLELDTTIMPPGTAVQCPSCSGDFAVPDLSVEKQERERLVSEFTFNCQHCQQMLEVPENMTGQVTECPSCGGSITLPEPDSQPDLATLLKPAVTNGPWLKEKKWKNGVVESSNKLTIIIITVFTVIINAASIWVIINQWDAIIHPENQLVWVFGLFPLCGLVLTYATILMIIRFMIFGTSRFEMAPMPGVIGGKLAGIIRINKHIKPQNGFIMELTCTRHETERSGSGDDRETRTRNHLTHQDELIISKGMLENDSSQTAIPVLFEIPYGSEQSGRVDRRTTVTWALTVKAKLPGADYNAVFTVPVFKTEDSSSSFQLDRSALSQYVKKVHPNDKLREQGISHEEVSGGEVFRFPMSRGRRQGIQLALGTIAWMSVPVFIIIQKEAWQIAAGFSAFGVILCWLTIDNLFWCSRVEIRHGRVHLRYGLFGRKRHDLTPDDIKRVYAQKSGTQTGHTLHYKVALTTKVNDKIKNITIGKRIKNHSVATLLADMYKEALQKQ